MRLLLIDVLHIFVSFTICSFGILSFFGMNGAFDNWTSRYVKRKAKSGLLKPYRILKTNKSLYNIHL